VRRTRLDQDSLLSLVGLTYDAAQDPAKWIVYLQALADAVAGQGAILIHHNLKSGGAVVESMRIDPDALALYNARYHALDVWALSRRARTLTLAESVTPDQLFVPRAELQRTEFYGDLVSRFDMSRMAVMTLAPPSPPIMTFRGITLFRSEHDPEFGAEEVSFLQALVPHLRRAFEIHERLSAAGRERGTLLEALDALPCAVFVVDPQGAVLAVNQVGGSLTIERDGVGIERGALLTASPGSTRWLRQVCAGISYGHAAVPSAGGAISLRRASSPVPVQMLVAPLKSSQALGTSGSRAAALVFVSDPHRDQPPSEALLRCYYGLTRTEAQVGACIAVGHSLEEIAAERGTTIETVRWYNKQVLAKTGCGSRAELVRQLTRSLSTLFPEHPGLPATGPKRPSTKPAC
jgi:DNA-binding CsgD family transcriptional regulator/PAS domain-containing protein